MKTHYFTFGQDHRHEIDGVVYDKDCVVEITSDNPRQTMKDTFGWEWGFQYNTVDGVEVEYYPRGVIKLQ